MNNVVEYKNCCPQEFCMFIEKLTGLKISLMQIAQVKGKKELIYLYNNKLKMWLNNSWEEIAEVVQESENKNIFILCNQPMDMKNAVCKVLSDPDIPNITTDLNGNDINSKKLSEVTSQLVITQTGTTVNPIPAAPAKDTYGTVTYTNNGNAVGAFNLRLPVTVTYKWGTVKSYVIIPVEKTLGN